MLKVMKLIISSIISNNTIPIGSHNSNFLIQKKSQKTWYLERCLIKSKRHPFLLKSSEMMNEESLFLLKFNKYLDLFKMHRNNNHKIFVFLGGKFFFSILSIAANGAKWLLFIVLRIYLTVVTLLPARFNLGYFFLPIWLF
jgi:hypothetical protein